MASKSDELLLQQKAQEFEALRQEVAGIDGELRELNNRLYDFERAKDTLIGLKNSDDKSDVLIPLGEGLFVKAALKNTDEVLIGVGSNVILGKSFNNAEEYVNERISEANKLIARLNTNAELFVQQMRKLEPELQALTSKVKQK